ncbi:MAG: sugar phosphate nucleotidyltransferase [Chthoniobacterales bacterium]
MGRITQAFVLGAGLGTRLRPLTEQVPKPLVPIFHKPLITFALDHLRSVGVESFVINTHRLAEQFEEKFAGGLYEGAPVRLVNEPLLLETGGGIKNAESVLRSNEPFITYSGDILTDIDLQPLINEHFAKSNDVTLALREGGLGTDMAVRDGRVLDIGGKYGQQGTCDFAGVAIWNPSIFERHPPGQKISFIPILVEWIAQGGTIGGVILNERKWFNIGSRNEYLEVHRTIDEDGWRPSYVTDHSWPTRVAADAEIAPSARLTGFCAVGSGCRIGAGAALHNTIVWPGAEIASQSDFRNCIVRARQKAEGTLCDADV